MKKSAACLILLVYAASCLGVGVRKFYCCGELRSVSVEFFKSVKEGGSVDDRGCCQIKHFGFKVNDSHLSSVADMVISPMSHLDAIVPITPGMSIAVLSPLLHASPTHGPPDWVDSCPLYTWYCLYRI